MNRKRTMLITAGAVLALVLIWAALSWANVFMDKSDNPVPQVENPEDQGNTKVEVNDKISDTAYAGKVTAITEDNKLTILVNGSEEYTYVLSARASRDLKALEIEVGNEVVVNFERLEDGTLSAVSLEKVIS